MTDHDEKRSVAAATAQPTEEFGFSLPIGLGAVLAALASLLTCYTGIILVSLFALPRPFINPHLQAVLMWGFAVVAVVLMWRNRERHGSNLPIAVGAAAAVVLIVTLYLEYDPGIEALAYVLLVIATLLNQNLILSSMNKTVRAQATEIDGLNRQLARTVRRQAGEIGRLERLRQFLAPRVAEAVVDGGHEELLRTHRRYIACMFCDIRNFTALSESLDPEDVIEILQKYHDRSGELAGNRGGTIGFRSGDGLMVFFNDPIPSDQPVLEAVRLAFDIRAAFAEIGEPWRRLGHDLGVGFGIASGHATLGLVGLLGRADYTAIGGAVNVAARLCDNASDGQILLAQRAALDVEGMVETTALGGQTLKGLASPVEVHEATALRDAGTVT